MDPSFYARYLESASVLETKAFDPNLKAKVQVLPQTPEEFLNEKYIRHVLRERRGVADVRCGDVFTFVGERFDTLLILMNGIGLVGTLDGLGCFLREVPRLLADGGQILLDSFDPGPPDPERPHGYVGEMRFQLEYQGVRGAFYDFLFLDFETLYHHAEDAGWYCESIWQEDEGHYLARLTRRGAMERVK